MKFIALVHNDGSFPHSHRYAKYKVLMNDGVKEHAVYFGDNRYQDFTTTGDVFQKKRYLARHCKREDFSDPTHAGFWSANLLWNKATVKESLDDILKRFPELK